MCNVYNWLCGKCHIHWLHLFMPQCVDMNGVMTLEADQLTHSWFTISIIYKSIIWMYKHTKVLVFDLI